MNKFDIFNILIDKLIALPGLIIGILDLKDRLSNKNSSSDINIQVSVKNYQVNTADSLYPDVTYQNKKTILKLDIKFKLIASIIFAVYFTYHNWESIPNFMGSSRLDIFLLTPVANGIIYGCYRLLKTLSWLLINTALCALIINLFKQKPYKYVIEFTFIIYFVSGIFLNQILQHINVMKFSYAPIANDALDLHTVLLSFIIFIPIVGSIILFFTIYIIISDVYMETHSSPYLHKKMRTILSKLIFPILIVLLTCYLAYVS